MERWENKVAIVTGASSGIGAQIVKDLINYKVIVVALARRFDKLQQLQNDIPENLHSFYHPIKCDVTKECDVKEAFEWTKQYLNQVDILINNAGIVRYGHLSMMSTQDIKDVIETNIMGIVYCTKEAFKIMHDRNIDGHIILVNSIAGHQIPHAMNNSDIPSINMYPPSKFAVKTMAEMYKQDFRKLGHKIKVTNLSPGLVDTEIVPEPIKKLSLPILQSEDVSHAILFVLGTPAHVQISELIIQPVGENF